ncbi:unnamed protein product [Cuscuta europaea]|uniref:F-box/LRR-repeat protein 15/At3g58940/PEG3-like LRR domain-containing protein n=1 Tax=Cuscuta europaea TaxID=41803 RepID=A0A9P0ZV59_CUSEU|nr:unnamed protein product [Cuscuta europaea]
MAGKDRISGLHGDIIDHILGFLPISDAARTSALSTVWRDAWLSLSQLIFDSNFFNHIRPFITESAMSVINKILLKHKGPIRKFVFHFCMFYLVREDTNKSRWVEFDEWLLFLIRNGVVEMDLSFLPCAYILPDFIFSCSTLKKLRLFGVFVEPIKAPCIFPNVTSLRLQHVLFDSRNLLDSPTALPMLKSLECENISGFNITAPKLRSLKNFGANFHGVLPFTLDLKPICYLHLYHCSAKDIIKELTRLGKQGTTLNVGQLKLRLCAEEDEISAFINLLRMCPKLYKLDIQLLNNVVPTSTHASLEHSEFIVAGTFQKVNTLNLSCAFRGSLPEMLLFKWLLACFPMLERASISQRITSFSNTESKNKQELLHFLRASSKADISYTEKLFKNCSLF